MPLLDANLHVPLRTDEGGVVRVGKTRVSLASVIHGYQSGATAEQIAFNFPTLDLADIHAVIAYYLCHRDEVEQYLADQRREAAEVRKRIESIVANQGIRERLMARRAAREGNDASSSCG